MTPVADRRPFFVGGIMHRGVTWGSGLAVCSALVVGAWLRVSGPHVEDGSGEVERARIVGTEFTSPFLEPPGSRDAEGRLAAVRARVAARVTGARRSDPTLWASVYVRDLERGAWTGYDEERPYVPASLMKVAVLFDVLDRFEDTPELAAETRRYPGPDAMPSPENLVGESAVHAMAPGERYTVRELLERMLVHSDNHAKDLLLSGRSPRSVDTLMAHLDLPARFDADGRAVMTARSYAALFRMLYHSSVFSRRRSELALSLLSEADFTRGLRAGVPAGVRVASKYGVHFDPHDLAAGQQLHECGIVYAPNGAFTLCIMTRSILAPADALAHLVADLTRDVWAELGRAPGEGDEATDQD